MASTGWTQTAELDLAPARPYHPATLMTPTAELYASRLPDPVRIDHGPTGLLSLEHDARRLGLVHGVLTGMARPRVAATAEGFLAQYGPDGHISQEARTAEVLRERTHWIENALRKATVPSDRDAIAGELTRATLAALEAETRVDPMIQRHDDWNAAFKTASGRAHRAAGMLQLASCAAFAYLMGTGFLTALLWGLAAYVVSGIAARLAFGLRFDRHAADDIKVAIYAERSHSTGLRVVEMHHRGLA